MKLMLMLLILISLNTAQTKQGHEFLFVKITEADLDQIGPWPIDRKWFAVLIESAFEYQAQSVWIDVAFNKADVFHPKSDDFFHHMIRNNNVKIRYNSAQDYDLDSVRFMGNRRLQANRFWGLFADQVVLSQHHIELKTKQGSPLIADFIDQEDESYYVEYPDSALSALSIMQALQAPEKLADKHIIVGLDAKGYSNYIQLPDNDLILTSSELEIWLVSQILNNQTILFIPQYLLFIILLIIAYLQFTRRKKRQFYRDSLLLLMLINGIGLLFNLNLIYLSMPVIIAYELILIASILYALYERKFQNMLQLRLLSESTGPDHGKLHAEMEQLKERLRYYEEKSNQNHFSDEGLLQEDGIIYTGKSPMKNVMKTAKEVAKSELSVLITGPTGSGKELLAKHIHLNSDRSDQAFVAVHCGGLSETLIESELFGHEKGAFTGANQQRLGRFELADGGSIFLDEVGETSAAFQVKLLRILQEGTFERVGGNETISVNVRVIAATHRDMKQRIKQNLFREDLFYRLAGYELKLPALKERPMDIQAIFLHMLNQLDADQTIQLSDALFEWLLRQEWQGNIRQLLTLTERAIVNAKIQNRDQLLPRDFEIGEGEQNAEELAESIISQLRRHQFKHRAISMTANDLNIHRITVTEYLRGTIIQQFIRSHYKIDQLLESLRGDSIIENKAQYKQRILNYLDTIISHIKSALDNQLSQDEIVRKHFNNLPGVFLNDLKQLIADVPHMSQKQIKLMS